MSASTTSYPDNRTPNAFTQRELDWLPWIEPLPEAEFTDRHHAALVDAAPVVLTRAEEEAAKLKDEFMSVEHLFLAPGFEVPDADLAGRGAIAMRVADFRERDLAGCIDQKRRRIGRFAGCFPAQMIRIGKAKIRIDDQMEVGR